MPIDPQALRATRTKVTPDEYLNRIPNRNLTEEDWELLDTDQRAEVRKSDLYDVKTNDDMKTAEPAPAPRRPATVTVTTDQTPSG